MPSNLSIPEVLEGMNSDVAVHFARLLNTPRPSLKEARARQDIESWAREKKLESKVDAAGNVAVNIPATEGYENVPHVIMQGHLDIYQAKLTGSAHNFETDPITPVRTGEYVHSEGNQTTLGADDGAGVSIALAIAEKLDFPHGPITLLFTVDEEKDMSGAVQLDHQIIPDAKEYVIINLDSEDGANKLAVGSAGSFATVGTRSVMEGREPLDESYARFKLELDGLRGGHSGLDIHRGYGNAILLLYGVLQKIHDAIPDSKLIQFAGGESPSALPQSASCEIAVPNEELDTFTKTLAASLDEVRGKLGDFANEMKYSLSRIDQSEATALSDQVRRDIFSVLASANIYDGVLRSDSEGNTTLSSNTGLVTIDGNQALIGMLTRAHAEHKNLMPVLQSTFRNAFAHGGFTMCEGTEEIYPAWQEEPDSYAVDLATRTHQKLFGSPLSKRTYHATGEAQIVKSRIHKGKNVPVSCVATGPLIEFAHSARERLHVPSVDPVYDLVKEMLKTVAEGRKNLDA